MTSLIPGYRVVITATITIYTITGYKIWKRRVELRSIPQNSLQSTAIRTLNRAPSTNNTNILNLSGTNNISVTTQITQDTISRCTSPEPDQDSITSFSTTRTLAEAVIVEDKSIRSLRAFPPTGICKARRKDIEGQHIPHHDRNKRSGYRATVVATNTTVEDAEDANTLSISFPGATRTPEGNAAAMAYFQVAFLMFLALFVVWLPSSINRMYQFIHKDPSFALNILSAIVLPLQGAWNSTIYISTTRKECKRAWGMTMSKLTGRPLRSSQDGSVVSSQRRRDSTIEVALE